MTFDDIERALLTGTLEMKTPWGGWVPVRKRGNTIKTPKRGRLLQVYLENQVESDIAEGNDPWPDVRIVERRAAA